MFHIQKEKTQKTFCSPLSLLFLLWIFQFKRKHDNFLRGPSNDYILPTDYRGVLATTLCDKICQLLATCWWVFQGTLFSSTNKTDHHNITEILLKVALNTITQTKSIDFVKED